MSSIDLPPEYRLVTEDRRRQRVRLTPFAMLSAAVVVILAVAFIVYGVRQLVLTSTPLQPIATVTPTATPAAAGDAAATPEATVTPTATPAAAGDVATTPEASPAPAAGACPTDRAQWRLVPYTFPGPEGEQTFYTIDPPCVMEQAERAFLEYVDARAERGARWTTEDMVYFYSPFTYTSPLSGEVVPAMPLDRMYFCADVVKDDGSPVTSADYHVVFFTVSDDGLVAVLLIGIGDFARTGRLYDCATGEVMNEKQGAGGSIVYQPVVYNPAIGRWQLGIRSDLHSQLSEGADPAQLIALVAEAQGHSRLQ